MLVVLAPPGQPSSSAIALVLVAIGLTILGTTIALSGGRSRLPFTASIAVAAVDVVLLVASDWVVARLTSSALEGAGCLSSP